MMLDGRSSLAFPVETAGRQLPRLPVRCGQGLQLRPGVLQANARLLPWDGALRCDRRIAE
jgi:hypothetical protein